MTDNRWVLFAIYFVSFLVNVRLLFFSGTDVIEHVFISLLTAAMFAYLSKYMKRFITVAVKNLLS